MTDLILNEEQQEFQKLAREFAQKEMAPKAYQCDQKAKTPVEIHKKAWEIGLVNACVPEDFGGLGLPLLESCVIAEELAAGCCGIAGAIEATTLVQLALIHMATDEQKKRYLQPLTEDAVFPGLDAELFSDQAPTVRATGNKEEFVLTGTAKIANASLCHWFLVAAEDRGCDSGKRLFIVPKTLTGVEFGATIASIGRKAFELTACKLTDVKVKIQDSLNTNQTDWNVLKTQANCILGSGAVGISRSALEFSIQYSKERKTFGKAISQHQAVAFILADMAKEIEAARLLVWTAAYLSQQPSGVVSSAVARSFAVDMAMKVATDAVQVYGGYGYSKEYPVEKLMRDAKTYQVYQGSSVQSKVEIGRQLIHQ